VITVPGAVEVTDLGKSTKVVDGNVSHAAPSGAGFILSR
jgi:hypothetical protein